MKTGPYYVTAVLAGLIYLPVFGLSNIAAGQEFTGGLPAATTEGAALGASTAESSLYASGTRAINESRWPDAEAIFARVANEHGEHRDGALYWQAYAENKQGQASKALDTCAKLGHEFPASSWIHECGALEIEIHARSGKPAEPKPGDDDDLKLLALNSLMQKDESRALAQIQEILNNNESSEKLRNEALFILGHHYSDTTYAQVVRISYVEGDVRIARGGQNEKPAGPAWERATADLPIEAGFSVVTGTGRAVIEFEDASTLYLGENSVLTLNDLQTTSGIPHSEVALLTGTVTLHIRPFVAGETFILRTPTDELTTSFPHKTYMRITSYTDAIAITGQDGGFLHLQPTGDEKMLAGLTLFFRAGQKVNPPATESGSEFAEWDKWVADRVEQRKTAMIEVMKAAGLSSPIPGLAEMAGQGRFFECKPYGTCWEPNAADEANQAGERSHQFGTSSARAAGMQAYLVRTSFLKTTGIQGAAAAQSSVPSSVIGPWDEEAYFPCPPLALRYRILRDPLTGKEKVVATSLDANASPYRWAVCHAGGWVHRRHHYVWVVGHKIHHVEPVRWVKSGRTVAFVPLHPYDVKGRPPINEKEEVFAVNNKNGLSIEKIRLDPGHSIEYLKEPPREYRTTYLLPLPAADVPRMEAHMMRDSLPRDKAVAIKTAGIPLSFDPKSQSFMMARQVMKGEKTVTVVAPVSSRFGNLQARGGSFAGVHSSSGGGSASRSGGGTGSSGGGGSHGGGSSGAISSSSGTSSTATLSAGSSGTGVSSAGGGHH
jgi:hypothetical protein